MQNDDESIFTIGEFAAKAGITQRTLRYYDNIGLLSPCAHSSSGHRLYSRNDFGMLQKILTLRFIGLSLEDISEIIKNDTGDQDFKKSLEIQREIMDKKIRHMVSVMGAIDEALDMLNNSNELNWDKFVNIINVMNMEKNWLEQYQNSSNLKARIRIHELYSTNNYGWMRWFFEQLDLPENVRILELGCGDGSLWAKNIDRIPDGWDITLTDFSQGMIKDAKENLKGKPHRFKFIIADAQSIPFGDSSFDAVIANHMLYHVPDMEKAFLEVNRVLANGGLFYASTVGRNHMAEMREIAARVAGDSLTTKSWDFTEQFQLENGMEYFTRWFDGVKLKRYDDNLIVTDASPLVDYIFSMPGNTRDIVSDEKYQEIIRLLENEIVKSDGIFITKDTGFFSGRKHMK